jgi:outer membrane protein TolC
MIRKGVIVSILLTVFLFFSHLQSFSQDNVTKLTLADAIRIAREQSPGALMAKHRFRSSYWQYRSYKAGYLPSLTVGGNLPTFDRSFQQVLLPEGQVLLENRSASWSANASINQRIGPTGGQVFLSSNLRRLDNFTDSVTYTQYMSTPINIGYNQPIFKYNAFKWEKKIEPMKYKEAKKKYLEDMEQVSMNATNYFFNLLLAQIQLKIAEINLANYDTIYKIAKGRYNLGTIAENELLQLELEFLKAGSRLEDTKINVDNVMYQFKSYLRIKDDQPVKLIPPDKITPFEVDPSKAIAEARANNSKALGFDRRLIEAEQSVNMAKMNGRFDMDLYAVYGLTQRSAEFNEVYNNAIPEQKLTVGVTLPIIDWGVARGKIKMAESQRELIQTQVEQDQIDFDQEIFLKVAKFNMQDKQVIISSKADTVAKKSYEITKARYLIGKISVTDLNIAQTNTDNSTSSYINTLRTYWTSYFEIRKLTLFDFEKGLPITIDYTELL